MIIIIIRIIRVMTYLFIDINQVYDEVLIFWVNMKKKWPDDRLTSNPVAQSSGRFTPCFLSISPLLHFSFNRLHE